MKSKKFLFVLVIALAAVLLSGCAGRTGFTSSWPGLSTDGETVYLASGSFVYAVRLSDGKEVWRYPEKASNSLQFINKPVISPDGTVIVGSAGSDHLLVALDPTSLSGEEFKTPAEKWTFTDAKSSWVAGVLIVDDKVYAPNSDGILYILDLQDGLSTKSAVEEIELGGTLWSQPSTDGTLIYVPSLDHHLHAIDMETATPAWPAIDLGGAAPGSPLVGPNGNVYIGSFASEMVKVDPATGVKTLLTGTQGWIWGGAVSDGQNIYFGDLDGNFFALDAASGDSLWSIQPNGPIAGSPVILEDGTIVFVTESGSVYAVDNEGSIAWQKDIGGQIYTMPVTGSGRIIVAPMQTEFSLAFLDVNGNQVGTFSPEK